MTINITHRQISALAKLDTSAKSHAERLAMFARALGFSSTNAMMAASRPSPAVDKKIAAPAKLPGDPVAARIHSDDYVVDLTVDARPFLATATAENVRRIAEDEFGSGYPTDDVFYALEGGSEVAPLVSYISFRPKFPNGDPVGFSVTLDQEQATAWLVANRPDLGQCLIDLRDEGLVSFDDPAMLGSSDPGM